MRRKLFWFLFFSVTLVSTGAIAQTTYEDVLYLKNGSILRGIIIEQVPNESLKIQTKDRNVFVYKMDEVLKIAKEEVPVIKKGREPLTKDNIKNHGYINITEIVFARNILNNDGSEAVTGNSTDDLVPSIGVQTVNGYLFNPWFSAGLGIGLHQYSDLIFVPIFADVRLNFINGPTSPFFSFGVGYSFTAKEIYGYNTNRDYFGGTYFNPAFGIKFNMRKTKGMAFSIGYRHQDVRINVVTVPQYYPNYNATSTWQNYTLGYLNARVGFIF